MRRVNTSSATSACSFPDRWHSFRGRVRRRLFTPCRNLIRTRVAFLAGPVPAPVAIGAGMNVVATVMNSATGQPIQKMTFGRMPKPWASFTLETGELVTADRVQVGKPAPGKFVAPVEVWVTPKR